MEEKISSGTWHLQEALRHSEEKHHRLLNSIRSPVLALTRDMTILYCNDSYSQLVGRPIAELEGQNVLSLFPAFRQTRSYAAYLKTLETGEPQEEEEWFGDYCWQVRVHPTPWGIIAIADDISARKKAEIGLMKEKQFSEAIIDSLPGIFYLFDEDGRMVRWNKNLEELSGYTSAEIAQMRPLGLISEADRSDAAAKMQEAFTQGQVTIEAGFVTKDVGSRPYFFTGRRFLADDKPYLLGVGIDISERKQVEAALHINEQRYQSLLTAAQRQAQEMALLNKVRTALAHELDLATIFRVVVQAIAETFGYTQVSLYLLQDDVLHLQHQVGYPSVISEIPITSGVSGRVARTGQPVLLGDVRIDSAFLGAIEGIVSEITVPLFDQEKVVGTLSVESTQGTALDEEDLKLILALSQDVNIAIHRARLYAEIRQSQERLHTVISNAPVVLFALDNQGVFTLLDGNGLEAISLRPEQMVGLSVFESVEVVPELPEKFQRALNGEQTRQTLEVAGVIFDARYAPLRNEQGEVTGVTGVALDITDRVKRERELEAFASVTRALRQANTRAQMLPIILEQTLNLLPAGAAMFVRYHDDGRQLIELAHGGWQRLTDHIWEATVATTDNEIYLSDDIRITLPGSQAEWLAPFQAVMSVPVLSENRVAGVLWVGREQPFLPTEGQLLNAIAEITATALGRAQLLETLEQRVLERTQELAAANVQLQELDRLKSKFIDDISHELRTPATTLNLYLDLLARSPENKRESYQATLRQQSQRLNQIIESILQFAHLADTAVSQTATAVNLNQAVAEAVNQYRPQAEQATLAFTFTPAANLPPVWGIAGLLAQATGYLLDNAIKYTPRGAVTVRTHLDAKRGMACVQIKDTGIGISPEELGRVFDRFYRGQRISQLTTPGAGLGLSLAQQIVARYGGQIEIESVVDVGTAVTLYLPLAKTPI